MDTGSGIRTRATSITTPKGVIKITGHVTCTSESLIYCISCRKCPTAVYIGETGRRLADRFREHRLDVIKKKGDLPVPHHFNSENHSLDDMLVAVVKAGVPQQDVRQREENPCSSWVRLDYQPLCSGK